jgi:hypothetical protein
LSTAVPSDMPGSVDATLDYVQIWSNNRRCTRS